MSESLQTLLVAVTETTVLPRIHLDQDGAGVFVYRLVDAATGLVLMELPRERMGELKAA